jgi:hypothetical protein
MAQPTGPWTTLAILGLACVSFAACGKPRNETAGAGGVANAAAVQAAADASNVTAIPGYEPSSGNAAAAGANGGNAAAP